jgi:hypothetical protein
VSRYIGLSLDTIPDSERKVARALEALDEQWTIIHGVTWQSARNGREGDGEADFLLLHPRYGIIVLEVKGGGIDVSLGKWTSRNRYGETVEIKNPFDQAKDSKHALLKYINDRFGDLRVHVSHAVCLPDMLHLPEVGPAGHEAIAWLHKDLPNVGLAVSRVIKHWEMKSALSPRNAADIVNALAPTLKISIPLVVKSSDAEQRILDLTAEQIEVLAGLKADRGGSVTGAAGSGKTLLAIARAKQLIGDGFRTLLVCYNEILGSQLAERLEAPAGSKAGTFHSLCISEARKAGIQLPVDLPPEWWDSTAPQVLLAGAAANGTEFDAIVVDEAQDFSPSWIEALRCTLKPGTVSPFYTFADPNQELWNRNWRDSEGGAFAWHLSRNLRNTQPIAERACAAIALPATKFGADGPPPVWRISTEKKHQLRDAISAIETMVDEGFSPTTLVVLCESADLIRRLREMTVGPYSLGTWGSRGIPVESVARFKGMEAGAAVIVLEEGADNAGKTAAYVAMSRPRTALMVVGPPGRRKSLAWD